MLKLFISLLIITSTEAYAEKFFFKKNFLTYYTSHNLNTVNSRINRLVIVVHGALRNGDVYFKDTVKAAKKHGVDKSTIIIAPHFRRESDKREVGEIYFGNRWNTKWKYGYRSQDSDNVSSFTLIDTLIKKIESSALFPNLKKIVITGHSAGGQFTQRYAIGSTIGHDAYAKITFVPSNPSSYMYLDSKRFHFKDGNYMRKNIPIDCDEFNHYIYGPINRAQYLAKFSEHNLKLNFLANNVTFLMSEEDKGTDSLDLSCEALIQGENRFERALNFWHYDKKMSRSNMNHSFLSIAGIGHDHVDVYESQEAGHVVFGIKKASRETYLYKKIGNTKDVKKSSDKLYLLLGGGANELSGFSRFLKSAHTGDILVISAKSELNHRYTHDLWKIAEQSKNKVDSVETISFLNRKAGSEPFIIEKIKAAEAIFFTGGDQSKYLDRIKGTMAHREILSKVKEGIPIAGTSAGLAVMGEYIFSAKQGGISSRYVLQNPHADELTIEKGFLSAFELRDLITDTHFMERNREGRLLSFMFRSQFDYKLNTIYGVGVDEKSSVIITESNMIANGSVYFYGAFNSINLSQQIGPLNYGPIKRLKLVENNIYPHFKKIDFNLGKNVFVKDGFLF